jgi:hypothetical protein
MKALVILLFCFLTLRICAAQECRLTDLSKKYIYLITIKKLNNESRVLQPSEITVEIIGKADKKSAQKLLIKPVTDGFSDCSAVRSYVTGKNANAEADDNDWGDFIVADYNFDGREDFAVKKDSFNLGATYEFFMQAKTGRFVKDSFLSGEHFPYKIDAKNKTLTTSTNATTAGYTETTYEYNPKTHRWRLLKTVHRKVG